MKARARAPLGPARRQMRPGVGRGSLSFLSLCLPVSLSLALSLSETLSVSLSFSLSFSLSLCLSLFQSLFLSLSHDISPTLRLRSPQQERARTAAAADPIPAPAAVRGPRPQRPAPGRRLGSVRVSLGPLGAPEQGQRCEAITRSSLKPCRQRPPAARPRSRGGTPRPRPSTRCTTGPGR